MARPKKADGARADIKVNARIIPAEKHALDKLIERHRAELASAGVMAEANLSTWLRSVIRRLAAEAGFPVVDSAPAAKRAVKRPASKRTSK